MINVKNLENLSITKISVHDIRFPTSKTLDGSDAIHKDPDYSCAYVILETENPEFAGHGFSFTLGRGTEIVVSAINAICPLVQNRSLVSILTNFRKFYRELTNESQLRWLGPEKGVVHLAVAAVLNGIWDLWAKIEGKPVWKLLVDLEPSDIISMIDFTYITDALTEQEALNILTRNQSTKQERVDFMLKNGLPAYITSVGWIGFGEEKVKKLCEEALQQGWTSFKMKVGLELEDDMKRAELIRSVIGYSNKLMMDANQVWDVDTALTNMDQLRKFKPLWIEEPTSPDDILGHKTIHEVIKKYGVGVATGEHCQNRVMFKQFLRSGAMQFCQIDACRVGSINELLAIILLAAKFGVPVCPHAGGVGLCELVVHMAAFNYACVSPSLDNVVIEYVDKLHEHFVDPVIIENCRYRLPQSPGYSSQMNEASIRDYAFPTGRKWKC